MMKNLEKAIEDGAMKGEKNKGKKDKVANEFQKKAAKAQCMAEYDTI